MKINKDNIYLLLLGLALGLFLAFLSFNTRTEEIYVSSWHFTKDLMPPENVPIIGYWETSDPGYPDIYNCIIINREAYEYKKDDGPFICLNSRLPLMWEKMP